jgi:hypothetical protein
MQLDKHFVALNLEVCVSFLLASTLLQELPRLYFPYSQSLTASLTVDT